MDSATATTPDVWIDQIAQRGTYRVSICSDDEDPAPMGTIVPHRPQLWAVRVEDLDTEPGQQVRLRKETGEIVFATVSRILKTTPEALLVDIDHIGLVVDREAEAAQRQAREMRIQELQRSEGLSWLEATERVDRAAARHSDTTAPSSVPTTTPRTHQELVSKAADTLARMDPHDRHDVYDGALGITITRVPSRAALDALDDADLEWIIDEAVQ